MQRSLLKRTVLAVLIGTLSCQSVCALESNNAAPAEDPCAQNTGQVAGVLIGAVLGGLLGNQVGKGKGRTLATVAGALGGLAIGNYIGSEMDRRKCELSKIARKNDLTVAITDINSEPSSQGKSDGRVGMSMAIQDRTQEGDSESGGEGVGNAAYSSQFQSGSDQLSQKADSYFREFASQYSKPFRTDALGPQATSEDVQAVQGLRQRRVLVIGHTDDTGSSRLNADLSESRARNVARLFAEAGLPASQIFFQGAGETQPVADNRADEGRARNRRVEIVDLSDEQEFQKYLASRTTNVQFYRNARHTAAAASAAAPAGPVIADAAVPKPARSQAPARPATSSRAAASAAAAPGVQATVIAAAAPEYDFGGRPVNGNPVAVNIGRIVNRNNSGFSLISPANADDMPAARSCTEDRPRLAHAVKSLLGNKEYHVSEYMPGLYGTSWSDRVNGNLVGLTGVAVLRDGAAPAKKPTLLLFKPASLNAGSGAKADYRDAVEVNTYQGEHGLLYRVFSNGPVKCMDVLFPRERAPSATSSLYYVAAGKSMVAEFNPKLAK
jgi:outer membrane protein OmpA-like peptidoglycan-associated protein